MVETTDRAPMTIRSKTIQHGGITLATMDPATIDEMIRHRRKLTPDSPLISYPSFATEYVHYTPLDLDILAYKAARYYYAHHVPPRSSSSERPTVVALLGPSDLTYLITLFSMWKLGHTVLLLSPRLPAEAQIHLMETAGAQVLIYHPSAADGVSKLRRNLSRISIPKFLVDGDWDSGASEYNRLVETTTTTTMTPTLDPAVERGNLACILHSSGSTGLPKAISFTHGVIVRVSASNMNMKGYSCVPLYHAFGLANMLRTIWSGQQLHLYNASLPLAHGHLLKTMTSNEFEILYCIPYALKLLAETQEGTRTLASCKVVMYAGSACPDPLGHRLTASGVNLVSDYGLSETGPLLTSARPQGDHAWDYLRPLPFAAPFLKFEDRGSDTYELVCLDGLPSKSKHNRPDKSYATRDLFLKHPTIEGAYKYLSRLDDTIVLINGLKVNPLILEGALREHDSVTEAVVFGSGKPSLGLMLVPSQTAASWPKEKFLDEIWPIIEAIHDRMPTHARVAPHMVVVLESDVSYPCTDKEVIIRPAFYQKFQGCIDGVYEAAETGGQLRLSEDELRHFLRDALMKMLPIKTGEDLDDDVDIFTLGMDSPRSIHLREVILRSIDIGGAGLSLNLIFEYSTVRSLAHKLYTLGQGQGQDILEPTTAAPVDEMRHLITKYGTFAGSSQNFHYSDNLDSIQKKTGQASIVALTGTTGSLGAHVLAKLIARVDVELVYCLVRADSTEHAHGRVKRSLMDRFLYDDLPAPCLQKIVAVPFNFSAVGLEIDREIYEKLGTEVTSLIHCAWPVNFNLKLSSFEPHIAGLSQLIKLCLNPKRRVPATFSFCSSVSVALNSGQRDDDDGVVAEVVPPELSHAQDTGYARSKLVGEKICQAAADQTGGTIQILRLGQLVGDTKHGIWNAKEAIPTILHGACTIDALPELDEFHRWLPVDVAAQAVAEISQSRASSSSGVFNIVNRRAFHWTRDLLPQLRECGLQFDVVSPDDWIHRIQNLTTVNNPAAAVAAVAAVATNPAMKLLEFFIAYFSNISNAPSSQEECRQQWQTEKTRRWAPSFNEDCAINRVLMEKMITYLRKCWSEGEEK